HSLVVAPSLPGGRAHNPTETAVRGNAAIRLNPGIVIATTDTRTVTGGATTAAITSVCLDLHFRYAVFHLLNASGVGIGPPAIEPAAILPSFPALVKAASLGSATIVSWLSCAVKPAVGPAAKVPAIAAIGTAIATAPKATSAAAETTARQRALT